MVVDPEKTADCEYVRRWSARVLESPHEILSSSIFNIEAANAPLAMGQEMFSANLTVSTSSFSILHIVGVCCVSRALVTSPMTNCPNVSSSKVVLFRAVPMTHYSLGHLKCGVECGVSETLYLPLFLLRDIPPCNSNFIFASSNAILSHHLLYERVRSKYIN